jgi:hypothetical protein
LLRIFRLARSSGPREHRNCRVLERGKVILITFHNGREDLSSVIVICEVYVTAISLGCQYNAPDIYFYVWWYL